MKLINLLFQIFFNLFHHINQQKFIINTFYQIICFLIIKIVNYFYKIIFFIIKYLFIINY